MTTSNEPRLDWTAILRRQPAWIREGQPCGGYTGLYEIICCECGDHPYLDYREVSPEIQRVRGPYPLWPGVTAYESHLELHRGRQADRPRASLPAEADSRLSSGSAMTR